MRQIAFDQNGNKNENKNENTHRGESSRAGEAYGLKLIGTCYLKRFVKRFLAIEKHVLRGLVNF